MQAHTRSGILRRALHCRPPLALFILRLARTRVNPSVGADAAIPRGAHDPERHVRRENQPQDRMQAVRGT